MNWFKQLFSRRRLFNELSEEIQAHLEEKIEELVASGMPRKEAAAAARREFGNVTLMEEDSRAVWQLPTVDSFFADIRYSVRSLRKDRRFALIAIFALALGIGASTVIFSIIYNGLLNPFPYKNANGISIFQIHDLDQAGVGGRGAFSVHEFLDYREQNHVFEDMVGTRNSRILYTHHEGAMQLRGAPVGNSDPSGQREFIVAEERRKPGVSLEAVAADLDVIAHRLSKVYRKDYPKRFNVWTDTLASDVVGDFKSTLYILLSAVGMLLLIACSNVANLLLTRATTREKEISIRASLGASRGRLIRQLLVESFMLATAGCVAGCILAFGSLKWVVAAIPADNGLPSEASVTLNLPALLFAAAITLLTTLLFGLAPALHAVHGQLQTRLAGSGKGVNANFGHGNLRSGLVIVEVALSLVLLIGAGLMMRSFFVITHVDLGFNPKNVLVAELSTPNGSYNTPQKVKLLYQQILQRVAALPGVLAVSDSLGVPPYDFAECETSVPGKAHSEAWRSALELCSEGYFQTLGFQATRGRLLSETDIDSARHVVVINETLARKYFGNDDPIGHTIKFNMFDELPGGPKDTYFEIIGVVGDFKNAGLQDPPMPQAFLPYTITGVRDRAILVRTSINPLSMIKGISQEIWAVDHNIALAQTGSLESFLYRFSYARPEFGLKTLGAFAGIGLLLVDTSECSECF